MSITEIKSLATSVKESNLLSFLKSSGAFGNKNPYSILRSLLDSIAEYEEPVPVPLEEPKPKPQKRTRRTLKKEDPIE